MDRILLVCSAEKSTKVYTENLKAMGYIHIDTENNGGAVRRRLIQDEYNLVIIDSPLRDEIGHELAIKISANGVTGVILVVKAENADRMASKVEEYGVFVISKPFSRQILYQGVKFVFTSLKRVSVLKKEQDKLLKKVEDIKKIDRAKCLLIQYKNMTEEQAHKYLEREAMNLRLSRREVADKVIKYYGV